MSKAVIAYIACIDEAIEMLVVSDVTDWRDAILKSKYAEELEFAINGAETLEEARTAAWHGDMDFHVTIIY